MFCSEVNFEVKGENALERHCSGAARRGIGKYFSLVRFHLKTYVKQDADRLLQYFVEFFHLLVMVLTYLLHHCVGIYIVAG